MHAKLTRITVISLGLGLGLSQSMALSNSDLEPASGQQDKLKEKPSLSVPYEEIELNGKSLPLTVDTLANLERYNQESELVEKVKKVLGKRDEDKARKSKPTGATASSVEQEPTDVVPQPKLHTVLSVFGFPGQMTAEVYASKGEVRQVKVGDVYRGFLIEEITVEGIRVGRAGLPRHGAWIEVGSIISSHFAHSSSRN